MPFCYLACSISPCHDLSFLWTGADGLNPLLVTQPVARFCKSFFVFNIVTAILDNISSDMPESIIEPKLHQERQSPS